MSVGFVEAISGMMAGMCQVMVGYPFDTIKVQLQTGRFTGIVHCVKDLNIIGLYRGIPSPLLGIGICNSVLFHSFAFSRKHIFPSESVLHTAFSGGFAGLAMATVNCPVELIMVKMQTGKAHRNVFECFCTIIRHSGFPGFFKGLPMILLRDFPSCMVYFTVYEYIKELSLSESSVLTPILAGACAGVASWLPCYPQDVIKSVIQSTDGPLSIRSAIHRIYARKGVAGFFSGIAPTILQAIPTNAATFLAFETVMSALTH